MAAMLTSLFFGARPETVLSERGTGLQGYLAHKNQRPPRTRPEDYA